MQIKISIGLCLEVPIHFVVYYSIQQGPTETPHTLEQDYHVYVAE